MAQKITDLLSPCYDEGAAKVRRKNDVSTVAQLLNASWELIDDEGEAPDFRVGEGEAIFGLEHVTIYGGPTIEERGQKPYSAMRHDRSERESLIGEVTRAVTAECSVALRVVLQGNVDRQTMTLLRVGLLEVNWASQPIGQRVKICSIPGLRGHAMRAYRPEWIDVDSRIGWVTRDGTNILQGAISMKSRNLPSYRRNSADDVRLLVVANHTFASGKVDLPLSMTVNTLGFCRAYFLATFRYAIEFSSDGKPVRRLSWLTQQRTSFQVNP